MHQLTGDQPPGKRAKALTYPPVIGTLASNQKRRAMLIAKQGAAQQSVQPTKATPRLVDVIVDKFVGLLSRLRG